MTENKEPRILLEAVAHHEAGHAVIAWRNHLPFKYVTIEPSDDGDLGHVLMSPPAWLRNRNGGRSPQPFIERNIVCLFAGKHAEGRFRGKPPKWGFEGDYKDAVNWAHHLYSSEVVEAYLHYLRLQSRSSVSIDWANIQSVAAALLQRKTLRRNDVIEVIIPGAAEERARYRAAARRKKEDGKPRGGK